MSYDRGTRAADKIENTHTHTHNIYVCACVCRDKNDVTSKRNLGLSPVLTEPKRRHRTLPGPCASGVHCQSSWSFPRESGDLGRRTHHGIYRPRHATLHRQRRRHYLYAWKWLWSWRYWYRILEPWYRSRARMDRQFRSWECHSRRVWSMSATYTGIHEDMMSFIMWWEAVYIMLTMWRDTHVNVLQ